jgi:hypothetical protein
MSATTTSNASLWTGRVLTGLALLFLLFDAVIKVLRLAPAVQATADLGFPSSAVFGLGVLELACIALYMTPGTSFLGAILLTGYLGGAVATHVRLGNPLFSHVLFPTYIGLAIWGGLYLRDSRLRVLFPGRARA